MSNKHIEIIIAEDENIIGLDIKIILEKLGYHVSALVNNGEAILKKIEEKIPDLVLMDIQLNGGRSGIEIAELLHKQYDIPVVYLTALTDNETLDKAKKTEPFGYVIKPFSEKSLHTAIEMALYKYSVESEQKKKSKQLEIEKLKNDNLLQNILPEEIISELKSRGVVSPRLYENITILFTDFEAVTNSAEDIPANILMEELNELFVNMDSIVHRYGLEKLKTFGDMYMICGGLLNEIDDHAEKIVMAAIEMKIYLDQRNMSSTYKWRMKAGINSGQAVAGIMGFNKSTYDVWGEAVNIASRLESSSEPGKINISASTYNLIKDYFDCEYRGKLIVKGKGKIDMYFVNGVRAQYLN